MIYAPIIIPTLCRYDHLVRLMESLKKNTWAKYTDIYIGLDYPPSEQYVDGYQKICNYLERDFPEFACVRIIKRTNNLGSFYNCESIINEVLNKYDRFIRTDDDAEFSPNFIEYMDKCLMKYQDDPNVIAVTGYSYPIEWHTSEGATILKENFSCPMWGTGFWRDKYKIVYDYIFKDKGLGRDADYIVNSGCMNKMLNVAKYEFVNLCLSPEFKDTLAAKMSDIAVRMYTASHEKYIIVPVTSKVRNWGFDGSGEYCQEAMTEKKGKITAKKYVYHQQPIDTQESFDLIEDTLNANDQNKDIMDAFDVLSPISKLKMYAKVYLYRFMGKNRFHKFTILTRLIKSRKGITT